jgi:tetratricopeptide (TPR) repeat protein
MNREPRRDEAITGGPVPQRATASSQRVFSDAVRHHQSGNLAEAERLYRQVLAEYPRHADSLNLLAVVQHQTGRRDPALVMIRQAIAINPNVGSYHSHLGNMLREHGRLDEAVSSIQRAIELEPNFAEPYSNLGIVLQKQRRLDEAAACYRRAIELKPLYAEAHTNLGTVFQEQRRLDDAIACYRKAVEINPSYPDVYCSLGVALAELARLDEAVACYRRAIDLKPDFPDAHIDLALALLARGDMAAGWEEHEWRWQTPKMMEARRNFAQPQWRGEAAEGRTLLIHAEQGYGDTLQFCRYGPLAAARGLRVIMEVQKPLVRLLRGLPDVALVVARGDKLPPFDIQCPMLSMPLAMGTTMATIPSAASYLHADAAQVAAWRTRLAARVNQGFSIGLAWTGNAAHAADRRRSIAPDRFTPLFEQAGLRFFSLQKGGTPAPASFPLTDFMPEMGDFADTAALISNLDLVISVDTSVAHLAAALGKPVWLLDRFDSDFRWFTGRRDSPWYPTLRLYRQPQPGDWYSVVAEVARDLQGLVRG